MNELDRVRWKGLARALAIAKKRRDELEGMYFSGGDACEYIEDLLDEVYSDIERMQEEMSEICIKYNLV